MRKETTDDKPIKAPTPSAMSSRTKKFCSKGRVRERESQTQKERERERRGDEPNLMNSK
jgi:hypothetical protein